MDPMRKPSRKPHQSSTSDGILIAGEADPGSEDHGAHKEKVTQKLSCGGQVNHSPSVQVKAQRDDFHGHHHLRASRDSELEEIISSEFVGVLL